MIRSLESALGSVQQCGYGLIIQLFKISQLKNHPLLRRQFGYCLVKCGLQGITVEIYIRFNRIRRLHSLVTFCKPRQQTLLAQISEGCIHHNSVYPGENPGLGLEFRKILPYFHPTLLQHIIGILVRKNIPPYQPIHPLAVQFHYALKGIPIILCENQFRNMFF